MNGRLNTRLDLKWPHFVADAGSELLGLGIALFGVLSGECGCCMDAAYARSGGGVGAGVGGGEDGKAHSGFAFRLVG